MSLDSPGSNCKDQNTTFNAYQHHTLRKLAILADVLLGCDIMRVLTYKYNCLVISIVSSGGVGLYEAFISDEN